MKVGRDVVLQKFYKDEHGKDATREFDGIVIGVHQEEVNIAYFNEEKQSVLSGVDWRLAFERVDSVKHAEHDDVKAGKEGFAYRLEAEEPQPEPAPDQKPKLVEAE